MPFPLNLTPYFLSLSLCLSLAIFVRHSVVVIIAVPPIGVARFVCITISHSHTNIDLHALYCMRNETSQQIAMQIRTRTIALQINGGKPNNRTGGTLKKCTM